MKFTILENKIIKLEKEVKLLKWHFMMAEELKKGVVTAIPPDDGITILEPISAIALLHKDDT